MFILTIGSNDKRKIINAIKELSNNHAATFGDSYLGPLGPVNTCEWDIIKKEKCAAIDRIVQFDETGEKLVLDRPHGNPNRIVRFCFKRNDHIEENLISLFGEINNAGTGYNFETQLRDIGFGIPEQMTGKDIKRAIKNLDIQDFEIYYI